MRLTLALPLLAAALGLASLAPAARADDDCKNHYILRCKVPSILEWLPAAQPLLVHGEGLAATLLADGRVLVTGGITSDGGAEIYDPEARSWRLVPPMGTKRRSHRAVLLGDGRVLVVGGDMAQHLWKDPNTAEIFDPATETWTPTPPLTLVRRSFYADLTATLLRDGTVLLTGGNDPRWAALAEAELFDPARGTWERTASLSRGRIGHAATLLSDGKVLVTGGVSDWDDMWYIAGAEIYDPAERRWQLLPEAPRIANHSATLLADGRVLVAGGQGGTPVLGAPPGATWPSGTIDQSWIYDPELMAWTQAGRLYTPRHSHMALALPDGGALAAAGEIAVMPVLYQYSLTQLADSERFDAATATWSVALQAGNPPRRARSATPLADGTVLVLGEDGAALLRYPATSYAKPRFIR